MPAAQAEVPHPDDAIRAVYQSQAEAIRQGDGARWLSLQTRAVPDGVTKAQAEAMHASIVKTFRARPGLQQTVLASRLIGGRGVIIARVEGLAASQTQYETVRFGREDGAWKIDEEDWSDSPIDLRTLDALLPPPDGAFVRAHSPWTVIPAAGCNTQFFKPDELDWKMQAARDEAYLYVRFEAKTPLPAAGTEIAKDDHGGPLPPIMKIKVNSAAGAEKEFEFQAGPVIQTRATFGADGHATSNRFFVVYSLTLRDSARTDIFTMDTNDAFNQLVAAQDRYLDVKI
ncbi:MAG TPA: hypothetical protein VMI53_11315, partial [Opitutaceae bacterium]|nr:hypothetical protein [Opitutaceae bacterium]